MISTARVGGGGLFGKGHGALQQERLAATEASLKAAEERLQAPGSAQTSNVASEELQHAKKELAEKTERLAATEASLKAAEERLQAPGSAQTSNVASEELQHAKKELAEKTERLAATEASLKAAEERLQAPGSAQTSNVASEELQHAKKELAEKTAAGRHSGVLRPTKGYRLYSRQTGYEWICNVADANERLRVTEASLKAAEASITVWMALAERRKAAEAQLKAAKATEEALQERVSGLQRSLQAARGKRQNRVNGIVAKSRAVLDWVAEEDAKGPDTSAPSKQTATVTSVP
ncbi:Reticulocyte-binding protein 2-like a, partial [Symbiodinium microadriaticum]